MSKRKLKPEIELSETDYAALMVAVTRSGLTGPSQFLSVFLKNLEIQEIIERVDLRPFKISELENSNTQAVIAMSDGIEWTEHDGSKYKQPNSYSGGKYSINQTGKTFGVNKWNDWPVKNGSKCKLRFESLELAKIAANVHKQTGLWPVKDF